MWERYCCLATAVTNLESNEAWTGLLCDHSNESCYYAVRDGPNFEVYGWNTCLWPFKWKSYWIVHSCRTVNYAAQTKMVLTFKSVDEMLVCDHSNKNYWTVQFTCGTVYYAVRDGANVLICRWNPSVCDHSNESYRAVLARGTVYYAVQGGSNFCKSVDETSMTTAYKVFFKSIPLLCTATFFWPEEKLSQLIFSLRTPLIRLPFGTPQPLFCL